MEIIRLFASVVACIIFMYLAVYSFYLFAFSLGGRFFKIPEPKQAVQLAEFVIYICAYKEDEIVLNSAEKALQIDYPQSLFQVCVIADSLQPETIQKLRNMPLQVVEVVFESSTKSKALNVAIQQTAAGFDAAVVFDIDNVASPNFLLEINNYLQAGWQVIQGHRVAMNTNSPVAMLDALSEEVNNHLFRRSQQAFGLSAAIIGSGMALRFDLFKEVMGQIDAVGGFDKEMNLLLRQKGIRTAYADNAIIFDEKVSTPAMFEKQRRRWLSAQFTMLNKYGAGGLKALIVHRNFDYFNEVCQLYALPRVILIGLLPLITLLSCVTPGIGPTWATWLIATTICYAGILAAIPVKFVNRNLLFAIGKLPRLFFTMFLLLFRLRGANNKFIHTPHVHSTTCP